MRALWNGTLLAESDDTVVVEGNHYFPPESLVRERFAASERTSRCPWKGKASYLHVEAGGRRLPDAAWCYPRPWPLARRIRGRVAFGDGIDVVPG